MAESREFAMKCEQIAEWIPDYLQGTLASEQRSQVESHLEGCAECKQDVLLWQQLGALPRQQPSPALRNRFNAMLESYQEGRWEKSSLAAEGRRAPWFAGLGNWFRMPAMAGVAWACVFLLCGFIIGKYTNKPQTTDPEQLQAIRNELKSTKQIMVLSMLQLQSASERLQAVSYSAQVDQADPQVLGALLRTVRSDSSVDVRLAALDALTRYGNRPEVRKGLIDAMQSQQSPMVQIALIDALVDLHDRSAVQQLKRVQQDPKVNPNVKKRAEWGIQKLS